MAIRSLLQFGVTGPAISNRSRSRTRWRYFRRLSEETLGISALGPGNLYSLRVRLAIKRALKEHLRNASTALITGNYRNFHDFPRYEERERKTGATLRPFCWPLQLATRVLIGHSREICSTVCLQEKKKQRRKVRFQPSRRGIIGAI